ncbi:glycosyltransferase family 4 protein [Bacteroides sp.]
MNILFLMLAFPNMEKSANMYTDLVEEFANQGHNVYPVAPRQDSGKTAIISENGINVLRVNTFSLFSDNLFLKGIANVLLPIQYKKAISLYWKNIHFDLIIMPTPPVTLVDVAAFFKKQFGCKFYLILRDIFPQNAVDLGMMKEEGILYNYFRKKETKLYEIADYIGCMSQGNIDYVLKHNPKISKEKLHILMNFQKSNTFPIRDERIKEKYGLKGKYLAVFGGNIGIPQKIENILALAKHCLSYEDVVFLLIGKGTQIERIRTMAAVERITNIYFMDFVPREDYLQLVSLCDVGLISLNEKFTIPNIPSKTMAYFDIGIPVLASIDANTDYGQMLEESGAGLYSIAGDMKSLLNNFLLLYNDSNLRKSMGSKGKLYLKKYMTPNVAYNVITRYV